MSNIKLRENDKIFDKTVENCYLYLVNFQIMGRFNAIIYI